MPCSGQLDELPPELLNQILVCAFYPGIDECQAMRDLCNFMLTSTASLRAVRVYLSAQDWLAARTLIAVTLAVPVRVALVGMDKFLRGTDAGNLQTVPKFSACIGRYRIAVKACHGPGKYFDRDYEFYFMSGQAILLRIIFNAEWGESPGSVGVIEVKAPAPGSTFYLGDTLVYNPDSNEYDGGYRKGRERLATLLNMLSCVEDTDMYASLVTEPLLQLVPDMEAGYLPIRRFYTPLHDNAYEDATRRACTLVQSVARRWRCGGEATTRFQ